MSEVIGGVSLGCLKNGGLGYTTMCSLFGQASPLKFNLEF